MIIDILKKTVLICFVFPILFGCQNNKDAKNITSKNLNELIFKKWLKDTICILKKENHSRYNKEIRISSDSLSMDIEKRFDEKIDPKNVLKIKNKELGYVMDLLDRNHDLPKDQFRLKFVISSYYSVSMVNQLKYEYDSEIKSLHVIKGNQIEKYKFLKGNLIEKKIVK